MVRASVGSVRRAVAEHVGSKVEGELINGEIRFISSFFVSQEYIL